MTRYLFIVLLATLVLNTGCNLIYKQNVQQGNAHEQEDLDQLELGMTKKQVAYLLGTPAIHDPFHQDRWDYISMLSRRGGDVVFLAEFGCDRLAQSRSYRTVHIRQIATGEGTRYVSRHASRYSGCLSAAAR